jgi:hypothetical protein
MHKYIISLVVIVGMVFSFGTLTWAEDIGAFHHHRIGAGLHYWVAVEKIDVENVDENGFSGIFSYQYQIAEFFRLEADLELFGEGYAAASQMVLSPQAYVLVGRGIYGGAGVGINYAGGDFAKSPFFTARAGLDLEIMPSIFLDLNASYRFETWDFERAEQEIDTDVVTAGAIVRLEF